MAATIANIQQGVDPYGKRTVEADVTFDSAYPTGGLPIALTAIGMSRVERCELCFIPMPDKRTTASNTHGRQVVPVTTNVYAPLLKVYTSNNTEATNASDQSQITQRVRFIGAV